jgi:hypothetical protein
MPWVFDLSTAGYGVQPRAACGDVSDRTDLRGGSVLRNLAGVRECVLQREFCLRDGRGGQPLVWPTMHDHE